MLVGVLRMEPDGLEASPHPQVKFLATAGDPIQNVCISCNRKPHTISICNHTKQDKNRSSPPPPIESYLNYYPQVLKLRVEYMIAIFNWRETFQAYLAVQEKTKEFQFVN